MKWVCDYYIFLDYSESLVGYIIIEKQKTKELLPKISKLHHYRERKKKRQYLSAIKKIINKNNIESYLLKYNIRKIRYNADIFADVLGFVKKHDNCAIFISVDNNQYVSFLKLFKIIPHKKHVIVIRENELKKDSDEHKLSLIIDTMLNLERRKE